MLKVIIVSESDELCALVKGKLESLPDYQFKIEISRPAAAYELARENKPNIIILDLAKGGESWLAMAETLLAQDPQMVLLVAGNEQNQQLALKAMRSGARDFLCPPYTSEELSAAISKAVQRAGLGPEKSANGRKVIVVFSNKGGTGVTTIACNIAVGLAQPEDSSAALVDLVLQHGDVSSFLNITPPYTIIDIVNNLHRADANFLKNSLTKHSSGVYLLTEPCKPEDADNITNAHISQLISKLRWTFDYVVIDGGHQFDSRTISALDLADVIYVVLLLDLPTIRSTFRCLEVLRRLGYSQEKVKLILNRFDPNKDVISLREVEDTLGYPIYWKLPNDFNSVITSINQGQPIFDAAKKTDLAASFLKLVDNISGRVSVFPVETKGWSKEKVLQMLHDTLKRKKTGEE
ncbi:MAG: response regulator [Candidatus Omnitrophota bacterium]